MTENVPKVSGIVPKMLLIGADAECEGNLRAALYRRGDSIAEVIRAFGSFYGVLAFLSENELPDVVYIHNRTSMPPGDILNGFEKLAARLRGTTTRVILEEKGDLPNTNAFVEAGIVFECTTLYDIRPRRSRRQK